MCHETAGPALPSKVDGGLEAGREQQPGRRLQLNLAETLPAVLDLDRLAEQVLAGCGAAGQCGRPANHLELSPDRAVDDFEVAVARRSHVEAPERRVTSRSTFAWSSGGTPRICAMTATGGPRRTTPRGHVVLPGQTVQEVLLHATASITAAAPRRRAR